MAVALSVVHKMCCLSPNYSRTGDVRIIDRNSASLTFIVILVAVSLFSISPTSHVWSSDWLLRMLPTTLIVGLLSALTSACADLQDTLISPHFAFPVVLQTVSSL